MHKTLAYHENNAKHLSQRYESANVDNIHVLLLKTFPSKSYLLEIGCGSGRDAGFMYQNGYDVLAIDGSEEMITEAKQYHPELSDRLEVLKIPDELHVEPFSFECSMMYHVQLASGVKSLTWQSGSVVSVEA